MAAAGFGVMHLFESPRAADLELTITTDVKAEGGVANVAAVLKTLPGHSFVLSHSPFFARQLHELPDGAVTTRSARKRKQEAASPAPPSKPQVSLFLTRAAQLPAAMAVLGQLYGKAPAEDLTHEQLLDAVVIAGLLEVSAAGEFAVERLEAAALSTPGLSAGAVRAFLALPKTPTCLRPLFGAALASAVKHGRSQPDIETVAKAKLLATLGDLEAVWADAELRGLLLGLELPVMELLLGCDELKVVSEDTVLFTAQAYVDKRRDTAAKKAATKALSALVRVPHLSPFWLQPKLLEDGANQLLLAGHAKQMADLLAMRLAAGSLAADAVSAADIGRIRGVPGSWLEGPRTLVQPGPNGVAMEWAVPVSKLQALCMAAKEGPQLLYSPAAASSPPLGGISFGLTCRARWSAGGVKLGLFGVPLKRSDGACVRFEGGLACGMVVKPFTACSVLTTPFTSKLAGGGFTDFFDLGAMAGGWDAAAWAAKGLPTAGTVTLKLQVTSVH